MTLEQAIDLLTIAAAFDRRTIGEADAVAWHSVLADLEFADCREVLIAHYRDSREWVMPADVRQAVRKLRGDRIARTVIPAPPAGLADNPRAYQAALQANVRRAADGKLPPGQPAPPAITGMPAAGRKHGQPVTLRAALGELRRALGPGSVRSRFRAPRDIAAGQAAESRAERDDGTEEAS